MAAPVGLLGWVLAIVGFGSALLYRTELRRRRELVARACHELRRPLTAARLSLGTIERRGEAPAERVAGLERELWRAGVALDDLSLARDGARRTDHDEPIDVAELLEEQHVGWSAIAAAFDSTVRLGARPSGCVISGDRLRLGQAVSNLVANALEHGPGEIELCGREVAGGYVRLEVVDSGPGLPASVRQLTRRARAGQGTRGRGLAIAAQIAEHHRGRLSAAPVARGTRIGLELPIVSRSSK